MKPQHFIRRSRTALSRAALMALAAVCLPEAQAATRNWNCFEDKFENAACWLPNGVPGAADDLLVTKDQSLVVFAVSSGTRTLRNLRIDGLPGTTSYATFLLDGGSLTNTSVQVGPVGGGEFVQQRGTHASASIRIQGFERQSLYQLKGGTLSVTSDVTVGGGSALTPSVFSHTGGTAVLGELRLGSGGAGTYYMREVIGASPAVLTTPLLTVGVDAEGAVFQSSPSSIVTATALVVGSAGAGRYALSAGLLETVSVGIGTGGNGIFEHSGGTLRVDDAMTVGATGRYSLSGTGVLQMPSNTSVINQGSFEQTGGSFTGTLDNQGSFFFSNAPLFDGQLINRGSVVMDSSGVFARGLRNEAVFDTLPTGLNLA